MADKKKPIDLRRVEPTPDLPPLPTEPAERRRVMKIRGW